METAPSLLTQTGFIIVTLGFYALFLKTLRNGLKATEFAEDRKRKIFNRTIVVLIIWMAIISALSLKGILSDFNSFPPKIALVLIIPLIGILILTFSNTTKEILRRIPVQNIIRIQVFRVFVEMMLWSLLIQNLMPVQMSFEGRNFDILAGLTAPVIAYLYSKNKIGKTGVIIWNILGLVLLFNIVVIAVLSMPTPFRVFLNEPSNTIVTKFPIVLLPAFLVPLAYSLHFISLRQLTMRESTLESKKVNVSK